MSSTSNTTQLVAPPEIRGYFKKLGERGLKTFKKRYFRQTEFKLYYYTSESDRLDHSKGFINMEHLQTVRKSDTYPNSFELVMKDSKRTYVLQIVELGENPEFWIIVFKRWLDYIEDIKGWKPISTLNVSSLNPIDSSALKPEVHVGSFAPADLLTLSSYAYCRDRSLDQLLNLSEEQLQEELERLESEISQQQENISTMQKEVKLLKHESEVLTSDKSTVLEKSTQEATARAGILGAQWTETHRQLSEYDRLLLLNERTLMQVESTLLDARCKVGYQLAALQSAQDEIKICIAEIDAKKASISQLESSIASSTYSFPPGISESYITQSQANTQMQLQTEKLTRMIRRKEAEWALIDNSNKAIINSLLQEIKTQKEALEQIKLELSNDSHLSIAQIEEFEYIRSQYFISLALSIKLQGELTGEKSANQSSDFSTLFQKAIVNEPDHIRWQDWLVQELFPGMPKSLIFGRRRAHSASSSTSTISQVVGSAQ